MRRGSTVRGQGWPPLRLERSPKKLAHKMGWSQLQLAERMARSDGTARWVEGQKAPSLTMQIHVAEGAA
jgi:hypothetical protein